MARAKWCGDAVYEAAAEFKDRCLIEDDSLFSPGAGAWTPAHVGRVAARIGAPGSSAGSFIEKLEDQLGGLGSEEVLIGAEILFMVLIPEADTGGAKRREHLSRILATMPSSVELPESVSAAVDDRGVANFGAGKAFRYAGLQFFGRLSVRVKDMPEDDRRSLFGSARDVARLVSEVRTSLDAMYANAFLHMLYPEQFEYMISGSHRASLVKAFARAPGVAGAGDVDQQIARIRELADGADGEPIDLYADPLMDIWKDPAPRRWQEAVEWADRLHGALDFDQQERDYKLRVAAKVQASREALLSGDPEWVERLRAAFSHGENNLTSWRAHDRFLAWCVADGKRAAELIGELWRRADTTTGIHDFLRGLPQEAVSGPGTRLSIASFLLLGAGATRFPFFKPTVYEQVKKLLGLPASRQAAEIDLERMYRPDEIGARLGVDGRSVRQFLRDTYPRSESEQGKEWYLTPEQAEAVLERFGGERDPEAGEATYADWVDTLEELRLRMLASGTQLRDLLDAQGVAWWLVQGEVPEQWDAATRTAFEAFRGGSEAAAEAAAIDDATVAGDPGAVEIPLADAALAERLFLPQRWLQHVLDLLSEKRQLIFYGPPGTGKTFIAQRIGEHIASHGGSCRLVQFHPSYTYEDFFEGYRPQADGDGVLRFDLARGALRQIAEEARARPELPHLLIVDEINRGNIAKIFGELYFLLEYRGESIRLQYSPAEEFRLPPNLLLVGTMNTADRSIALVDSALRRRFYFVELHPAKEPVDQVLTRWLAARGHPPEPAVLLAELNRLIDDEDFAIGPSYFMGAGTAPDLVPIWAHSIVPLLEERYYGTGRPVASEFGLAAVRSRVAAAADATGEQPDGDSAAGVV